MWEEKPLFEPLVNRTRKASLIILTDWWSNILPALLSKCGTQRCARQSAGTASVHAGFESSKAARRWHLLHAPRRRPTSMQIGHLTVYSTTATTHVSSRLCNITIFQVIGFIDSINIIMPWICQYSSYFLIGQMNANQNYVIYYPERPIHQCEHCPYTLTQSNIWWTMT